ncbi:hypothetical protein PTHTG4_23170 [Parageobacillus thermoglucosidasius]|nr:hypothetical protein PTHTG4_23170 [Parageobacillus thermoglucosidasius]
MVIYFINMKANKKKPGFYYDLNGCLPLVFPLTPLASFSMHPLIIEFFVNLLYYNINCNQIFGRRF